jgi:hypothetical protein
MPLTIVIVTSSLYTDCELQWLEGEEGESAECESDAVPCELQWLEGEEGESGFAGNELA